MVDTNVRVRFAPAPTGYLHVGSARSALFNWMYARHTGGTLVLRVEDTDADRSKEELIESLRQSLAWLGIDWDEEYLQSDRFELYRQAADKLLVDGLAYRCDCSQEQVKARAEERGESGGYDSHCRDRDVQPGEGVVVRFRTPDVGVTAYDDIIRGRVEFDNSTLEDFVIVRASGVPLFHVANAYDDLHMGITHVVRGEDLVNTVPRVLLLRQAMGGTEPPIFAHLPLIVNEKRQKLSKRRDDVSVGDFADKGFLPEAMRNYLLTLGWGPRDEGPEIRPIEEFIKQFELTDINKAPAFFDVKKLEHFNAEYIRALTLGDFIDRATPYIGDLDQDLFGRHAAAIQERVRKLDECEGFLDWVVGDAAEPSEKDWRKVMGKDQAANEKVEQILDLVIAGMKSCEWSPPVLEELVFAVGKKLEAKTQLPVRLAVTGSRSGLPLFEPLVELDRAEVLSRLEAAKTKLSSAGG